MLNDRPLVTFAIISFNHERFIAEAVESALAQTYSPLEVIISDDFSKDATFTIIEKIVANYTGPHKVIIHRNPRNLGLAGNVNKVWELSSGELVVFQGGDDISLPHRTSRLVEAWAARTPRPDLVYSGVVFIDEEGKVISANAVSGHPLLKASAVAAARQARFSPTKLSGKPVKVTGIITYNFVAEP